MEARKTLSSGLGTHHTQSQFDESAGYNSAATTAPSSSGPSPSHKAIVIEKRSCAPCGVSLFIGFLIPAVVVALAFFLTTWVTMDRSAKASISSISERLFDVTLLHLQHSIDSFLQTLPTITELFEAHYDMNPNIEDMKQFAMASMTSLASTAGPVGIGFVPNDGSFFMVYRRFPQKDPMQLGLMERSMTNCSGEGKNESGCSLVTIWRLDTAENNFSKIDPPIASLPHDNRLLYDLVRNNPVHTYVSPFRYDRLVDGVGIMFLDPVFFPNGSFAGFIRIDYLFNSLVEVLQSTQAALQISGTLLLVNKNGIPLASSSTPMSVDGGLNSSDLATLNGISFSQPIQRVSLAKFGDCHVVQLAFHGQNQASGIDWRLFVIFPRSDFYAIVDRQNQIELGLFLGCIVGFFMVLAFLFRFLLTVPLQRLSKKLVALKEIVQLQQRESSEDARKVSPFSELVDLHQHVMDVVTAAEKAAEERIREMQQAAEAEREREATQKLMKMKELFFAMMAWLAGGMLVGIIGMSELLHMTPLTSNQKELLDSVLVSGQSMMMIVNNILDFSKLEADKVELEAVSYNVREVLEKVMQTVEVSAEKKGVELILQLQPSVPELIEGDPIRLQQVLSNLVSNSLKFTQAGLVLVKCFTTKERSWLLHIEVEDTGVGMAPEVLETLFRPFHQADASIHRNYGGSGLGLVIAKKLVLLMGGQLVAHSEGVGAGSKFSFSIPITGRVKPFPKIGSIGSYSLPHAPIPAQETSDLMTTEENGAEAQPYLPSKNRPGSVIILDSIQPRRQAMVQMLRHFYDGHIFEVASTEQLRLQDDGGPVLQASVVIAYLQDHSSLSPDDGVQSLRSVHRPASERWKILFVSNIQNSVIDSRGDFGATSGWVCVSKPVTINKLIKAYGSLFLETASSPQTHSAPQP